jgi:hypothetical protein
MAWGMAIIKCPSIVIKVMSLVGRGGIILRFKTTISKLHLHIKSGGQMSSQTPVVWWYREVNCEVVGMCVKAVPVLGSESVDSLFN